MSGQYDEVVNFWADGNYAANKMNAEYERRRREEAEKRITDREREEKARNALAAALWRIETHRGRSHCHSCETELWEYNTGVMMDGWCCCKDERNKEPVQPLDDPDYEPKYPPVDGQVPDVFHKWGESTQRRYLHRFRYDLDIDVEVTIQERLNEK